MKIENITVSKEWLGNINEYTLIEDLINKKFLNILNQTDCKHSNEWEIPYFNHIFFEGEDDLNGNPIFSARHISKNYIIRVIIDEDYNNYTVYVSYFDDVPVHTICLSSKFIEQIEPFFIKTLEINHR